MMESSPVRDVRIALKGTALDGHQPQMSPPLPSAASAGSATSSRNASTIHSAQTPPTSAFSTPDAMTTLYNPLETPLATKEDREGMVAPPSPSSSFDDQSSSTGYTTEAKDGLSPLPSYSTMNPWAGRLPLPSPPAQMGLSELLSGGSPMNSPSEDSSHGRQSYFSRSFGERPKPHQRKSSTAEQDFALAANRDADGRREVGPYTPSIISEASSRSSDRSGTPRLPRVRNMGGILAPHGTFSSASSSRLPQRDSGHSSTTSSSSRRRQQSPRETPRILSDEERGALEAASKTGDQLALHFLGYGAGRDEDRHTLGLVNDVWGPSSSSASTRSISDHQHREVDLLDEALKLASRLPGRQNDEKKKGI